MLRVTQILSMFQNMWKIPQEVLARKAAIGTNVHHDIGEYLLTKEATDPYVVSFSRWYDEMGEPKLLLLEQEVCDEELGVSGTPDAIFRVRNTPVLIDFKTSVKDDPVAWRLQGTAYVNLLRRGGIEVDDCFFFLKLDKEGKKPSIFAYQATDEGWNTFLKARDCALYYQKWKGRPLEEC